MSKVKIVVSAAAMCFALGMTATAASADDQASEATCLSLAGEVRAALDSHSQSPGYHDAMQERMLGREYCGNSFYEKGAEHYQRALQLLGVQHKN